MKILTHFFLFVFVAATLFAEEMIVGFWKRENEDTGKRQCVIAVYPYQGKYYGRILATFDDEGKMADSINAPIKKAPGIQGNPPFCGLDLIWNLTHRGNRFDGKIVDPRKGKVYDASVWRRADNLIIRGKLLFFGQSTTWIPAEEMDLPPGFKPQDTAAFVPKIPKAN
jgi:uncharacterized protein (DUF2147 family)